jgi:hypothetical protein
VSGLGEVRQRIPVLQGVVQGDAEGILRQHGMHSLVEPGLELGEQRNGFLLPLPEPVRITQIFDLSLDAEEGFVERQRLVWSSRLLNQVRGFRELAAGMQATTVIRPSTNSGSYPG